MESNELLKRLRDNPVEPENPLVGTSGVSVKNVLRATRRADGVEKLMDQHPDLEPEDIMAALLYAGGLRADS